MIRLTIPLEPYGAARQRARAQPTDKVDRNGDRVWRAVTYKAAKYRKWCEAALPFVGPHAPPVPLEGPLECRILFVGPTLKSETRVRTPASRRWWDARPDLDNLLKAVWDVLQDCGYVKDDGQIVRVVAEKVRAAQGEEQSIKVVLAPLETYTGGPEGRVVEKAPEATLPLKPPHGEAEERPEAPARKTPLAGRLGACRSCGAAVVWAKTDSGKWCPYDPDGASHFTTCPDAGKWSRKGRT